MKKYLVLLVLAGSLSNQMFAKDADHYDDIWLETIRTDIIQEADHDDNKFTDDELKTEKKVAVQLYKLIASDEVADEAREAINAKWPNTIRGDEVRHPQIKTAAQVHQATRDVLEANAELINNSGTPGCKINLGGAGAGGH